MKSKIIKNIGLLDIFKRLSKKEKQVCLLYNTNGDGFEKFLGFNPVEEFTWKIGEKNKNFISWVKKNSLKKRKLIGYLSYDYGLKNHDIKNQAKDDLCLPDIYFLSFENYLVQKNNNVIAHFLNNEYPIKVIEILKRKIQKDLKYKNKNFKPIITNKQYTKAYQKIKKYILDGDIYQINLTHRLEGESNMPARKLFQKIIIKNPVNFLAFIEGDNFEILSASPERFIKIKNKKITTCPIKGTIPRGKNTETDKKNKTDLIKSEKEKAELNMITDLLRNDMGKIAKIGSVKVIGKRLISKCPTVWHTYSKITAQIHKKVQPVRALISMLPGGSITGCPKKRAIEIIDEIEPVTRSIYTGVIGYIDPNMNMDFNIAIRTIIKKNKKLYLSVGGGIVYDSTEKAEYKETLDKASSFMNIL